jgi:hypothetical protein
VPASSDDLDAACEPSRAALDLADLGSLERSETMLQPAGLR